MTAASGPPAAPALPAGLRIRGQAPAATLGLDLVRTSRAQSILLVGPSGVGKTTLALDLATTLLCRADDPELRPCRECRACRMVAGGNHPDLHRLVPDGPGGQIRIGSRGEAEPGTVRRLIADLALMPVEGGARVAIVEHADRMNEDAQSALLKTLEEPPAGATILLCADEEDRLLPTVRSRCARIRLGPLGARAIEALLGELGAADPPTAARLGRLASGRPGVALAWAAAPEAVTARGEMARVLLDLLAAGRAARLTAVLGLLASAAEAAGRLALAAEPVPVRERARRRRGGGASSADAAPADAASAAVAESAPIGGRDGAAETSAGGAPDAVADATASGRRAPAAERRRAALLLVEIWRSLARDLAVVGLGEATAVRDPGLLDDLPAAAASIPGGAAARFLEQLDRAGELLEANVSPELVVDGLVLAWPRAGSRAADDDVPRRS